VLQLQRSWVPGHRCMGKGQIHYIEVTSDSEEEEEIRPTPDMILLVQRRSMHMRRDNLQRNHNHR
jgi:hypothetical protein